MMITKRFVWGMLLFVFFSANAHSAEPKKLTHSGAWTAFVLDEGGQKVCYMVSKPKSHEGDYTQRGEIFAFVTHRPAENTRDVFTYISGYSYKPDSDASVNIDGKKYLLFTKDDTAWAGDAKGNTALVQGIQKGTKMVVKGFSSRGTETTDTFSLKGAMAAYKEISRACGIN